MIPNEFVCLKLLWCDECPLLYLTYKQKKIYEEKHINGITKIRKIIKKMKEKLRQRYKDELIKMESDKNNIINKVYKENMAISDIKVMDIIVKFKI